MMERALVGVFDDQYEAQQARDALLAEGFPNDHMRIASGDNAGTAPSTGETAEYDASFTGKIASFFGFGEDDVKTYSEAVRRGSYVLVADVADEQEAERVQNIMEQYNPVDIDERAAQWRESGRSGSETGAQTTGEEVIPVVEEELRVGKRETQRSGIRVRSHNYEKPVEANIELREERSKVERRPVDRPATDADMAAFKESSFDIREIAEEPVIAKTARVVEEVVIDTEVTERTETISDSVRRTDVDVDDVDGEEGKTATTRNSEKPSSR
jgi:stress response protein YsnF